MWTSLGEGLVYSGVLKRSGVTNVRGYDGRERNGSLTNRLVDHCLRAR